ncbi:glycerophosphodiester phosphodiesterase [Nesterenkonia populi]|uniref:glycerophosphodiester phosphodiesterase n=1 Tax=Nesterenkonia populi TaxID=1591087 RepID=UPI0011BDCE10|nr:glycerophosphodiester phosphodiesterase family protein [Nesterenkonia populi]
MTTAAVSVQSASSCTPPAAPRRRAGIFAHRGASGVFAEHTRAAYLRALEEGADGLEIDVHLTRDGEVVCFHDATLERTTDGRGALAGLTLAQLRTLDVTSWRTPDLPREYGSPSRQLMTLQDTLDVLSHAGRSVHLAVELKHPSPFGHQLEDRVLRVLLAYGWDPETSTIRSGQHTVEVSFMSFSPGSLRHLGELVPAERLCALLAPVTGHHVRARSAAMRGAVRGSEALVWNRQIGMAGPGISYVRAHRAEAKAWIARGARLRVWTVDTQDDAEMLLSLGVQEITTNYPERIIRAVSSPPALV